MSPPGVRPPGWAGSHDCLGVSEDRAGRVSTLPRTSVTVRLGLTVGPGPAHGPAPGPAAGAPGRRCRRAHDCLAYHGIGASGWPWARSPSRPRIGRGSWTRPGRPSLGLPPCRPGVITTVTPSPGRWTDGPGPPGPGPPRLTAAAARLPVPPEPGRPAGSHDCLGVLVSEAQPGYYTT
jgi:hypothetical protein